MQTKHLQWFRLFYLANTNKKELIKKIIDKITGKKNISIANAPALQAVFPQLFHTADLYSSFAYACINARANNMAQANVLVQKYQSRKWQELKNPYDYVYNFFQRRNLYDQTINDLIKLTSISLDLKGVSFWQIVRDPVLLVPQYFMPLPSSVNLVMNDDNTDVAYYELRINQKVYTFAKEDVIMFKLPVIDNPFSWKATVDAIPNTLAIDTLQTSFQKSFLTNNARFDGFLSTEKSLTDAQRQSLKEQWQRKHAGVDNAGKTPVLDGGLTYQQMQSTVREMDYVNSRNMIRDEILTIFNTPKSILGITDDVNRANALATISSYIENNIIPFSKNISDKLTSFVKTNFRENLRVIFDFQMKQDPQTVIEQNKLLIENKAISINELRAQYNYDEVPGFDELGETDSSLDSDMDDNSDNENNNGTNNGE